MDVQADDTGLLPDPSATAIFERPVAGASRRSRRANRGHGRQSAVTAAQQQLFADAYPTYADTDKIPAVSGGRGAQGRRRPGRILRVAVVLVALAVLAAGAALGLVKAGVIGTGTGTGNRHRQTVRRRRTTARPPPPPRPPS